jgi:hypothetical protein
MKSRLPIAMLGGFAMVAALPALAQVPLEATDATQSAAPADTAAASATNTAPKKHKHMHMHKSRSSDSSQPAPTPQ